MCSIVEPRRAIVSCKNLFTTTDNERVTMPCSSRRHIHENINNRRAYQQFHGRFSRTNQQSKRELKQNNPNLSTIKQFEMNGSKLLRKPLNPLSPAFDYKKESDIFVFVQWKNEENKNRFNKNVP